MCMRSTRTLVYADYYFQAEKSKVAVFKISSICLHIPQVRREICIFFSFGRNDRYILSMPVKHSNAGF